MPLRKKNYNLWKIVMWILIILLVVLMIVYFPPTNNVTEVILYQ